MALLRLLLLLALAAPAWAADTEAETAKFLREVFSQAPLPDALWLTGDLRPAVRSILEHDYPAARLRYWRIGTRTAWVLDEIGKEMPITVGIAVDGGAVERVRVLAYRESRGWEVKDRAFTSQFDGARLTARQTLDRGIDGISGATLSVRALGRLTRLALLLHGRAVANAAQP
ncbi:MAG: FMN-binding protein [Rhodocyclaceae bacterium]|nr:FMN-binding protein [Rhodocyclaceae bacterium]PKO72615.1 MAG: FMN-binding protein [Betaproteobacteria bacterium HGW-Betaproteobacteria-14]